MLGPVSQTGRAMMASLQQAIGKGMPVDQAIAYVKSMANDGVAPLVDLYALMKQFERMKQQQVRPPQTPPTIRDQMNMLEATRSQGGLPSAMPPQNPQAMMGQGLGGLPAGRMENPSFAGGGIVAFDEGGQAASTSSFYSPIPQFKSYDEMAEFFNRQLQDPKMVEQEMARREEMARQQKMDEYAPSFGMRESLLAEDKAAAARQAEEDAQYDTDEYWGDVAANAAQSGATLLSSLAKAQKGKAVRKRATAEKAREAIRAAKQSEILLQQAKEAEKEGRYKDAEALRAKAAEAATGAREKSIEARQKQEEAKYSRETQYGVAERQKRPVGREAVLAELSNKIANLEPGTPEYDREVKRYNTIEKSIATANIRSGAKPAAVDMQVLRDLGKQLQPLAFLPPDHPTKKALQDKYDALVGKMTRQGVAVEDIEAELSGGTSGTANLPPGFVRD
jgi:chemotaxis protein histidine kinase CheA